MKNSVTAGFIWKLLERFGVSGAQFILQIILARLLEPQYYGTLSIMVIFVSIANVFVQGGLNTALIQSKEVEEDDYSSIFWVSIGVATVLYMLIFIASPWIADFYNMPEIIMPMRVLALMLFPGALNSVQLAKISRELDFKKVFFSNIGGTLVSGVIGIIIAYIGGGLWALVAQSLLNVLISCFIMRITVQLKIRFYCDLKRVKQFFAFGWKLLVSSLLETFYQDLESLVVGKKFNSGILGYYNRGKQFPQFIITAVNGTVQSVLLPVMSAAQDDKKRVKDMMRKSIMISAYIIFPMTIGLAATASSVVSLILSDKWLPCVPYMQIYCLTFAFYPIHSCNLQAINAMGRSDIFLKLEIIKKTYGIFFIVIATLFFESPIAIALTGLVTTWIGWFVNSFPNKKLLNYSYLEQIKDLVPSFLISLFMGVIVYGIGTLSINKIILLFIQVSAGIGIYLILSLIIKPEPFKLLIAQINRGLTE